MVMTPRKTGEIMYQICLNRRCKAGKTEKCLSRFLDMLSVHMDTAGKNSMDNANLFCAIIRGTDGFSTQSFPNIPRKIDYVFLSIVLIFNIKCEQLIIRTTAKQADSIF